MIQFETKFMVTLPGNPGYIATMNATVWVDDDDQSSWLRDIQPMFIIAPLSAVINIMPTMIITHGDAQSPY